MKIRLLIVLLLFGCAGFKGKEESKSSIGKEIADFSLKNTDGSRLSLSSYKNARGFMVVFTCNHCPFAKLYTKRCNDLNKRFSKWNVPLIAINSMDTGMYEDERFELMQRKAKTERFNFPYLCDGSQNVGRQFGANHTPHAYILWKENQKWIIKYSGSIDDNGQHPENAIPLLANAVNDLLSGRRISEPETASFGCRIYYRSE